MHPRHFLVALALSAPLIAPEARAESEVSPTGKGITGCAMLGAEVVMITEGVIGIKPWWAYAIGGGVGAIGGGIGGYFTESWDPKIPFYLFMGGMALVIPTTVVVLNATKWQPVNYTEDQPPPDEPVPEPAAPLPAPSETPPEATPETSQTPKARRAGARSRVAARNADARPRQANGSFRAPMLPPALLEVTGSGSLSLSVPAVEVRHVYTRTEVATFGMRPGTLVTVPVLNVVF